MYVHFDKTTLDIVMVSPTKKPTDNNAVIQIDDQIGLKLVLMEESIHNFFVYKFEDKYVFDKKQEMVNMFSESIRKFGLAELSFVDGPVECSIIHNRAKQELTIKIHSIMNRRIELFSNLDLAEMNVSLYISKKNDPTYLLFTSHIVVSDIVKKYGGEYTFKIRPLPAEVSVFTQPIFNSYSLELIDVAVDE